jgi:chromosomal replication initiation ATPase DnaA
VRPVQSSRQPALPLFRGPRYGPADFLVTASNAEAAAWLNKPVEWPGGRLAIWGEAGCGKTHLLHVWREKSGAAIWFGPDLRAFADLPPHGIAVDHADAADETALFHLLNAAGEAGLPLLLASRDAPARWPVRLPDLRSRLRAITAVQIAAPDDSLLRALLPRLLADRLIRLPEPVLMWLLSRLPRTVPLLAEAVARLDAVALEHHRDITVPMAREVLAGLMAEEADEISGTEAAPSQEEPRLL